MKRQRPPLVVTVSVVTVAACQKDPPPPETPPVTPERVHANPPPQSVPVATASASASAAPTPTTTVATSPEPAPTATAAASARKDTRISMADFRRTLNAYDKTRGMIHPSDKGCFVWGEWPDTKPRAPGMMPPPIAVPCPASMQDAPWKGCVGGSISTNEAGDACACFVGGNPPPPPRSVTCPASAKAKSP